MLTEVEITTQGKLHGLTEDELVEILIGFVSGIGVAVIAAFVGVALQRRNESCKRIEDKQFQVYIKLLNVYNLYFWVASCEIRKEEVTPDCKRRIQEESWKIADLLRSEDNVPFVEEILHVLMSNEYPSATARHDAMDMLLNKLGIVVNPRYQRVIKSISDENIMRIGSSNRSAIDPTTPSSMGPL